MLSSELQIKAQIHLLIVEDRELDAELILAELTRSGLSFTSTRVETRQAFLEHLTPPPDVILCDYNLPSFDALEALDLVHERKIVAPFLIISGSIGEETAVKAMKRGAADYLLKDRLGRLATAISQALEQKEWQDAAKRAEEALRESEFKYRCLFEHLRDAAYLANAATARIIDLNREGERLLGLERAAVLGSRVGQYLPSLAVDRLLASRSPDAQSAEDFESEINFPSAASVPVEVSASWLTIHGHRLILILVRDLNERRSALQAMRERARSFDALADLQRRLILMREDRAGVVAVFAQGLKGLVAADVVSVSLHKGDGIPIETASAAATERVSLSDNANAALLGSNLPELSRGSEEIRVQEKKNFEFTEALLYDGYPAGFLRVGVEKRSGMIDEDRELVRRATQFSALLFNGTRKGP